MHKGLVVASLLSLIGTLPAGAVSLQSPRVVKRKSVVSARELEENKLARVEAAAAKRARKAAKRAAQRTK